MGLAIWIALIYVIGGLTLIPSVILGLLVYLHFTLPQVPPEDNPSRLYDQVKKGKSLDHRSEPETHGHSRPPSISSSLSEDAASINSKSNPSSPIFGPADRPLPRNPSTSLSLDREHETGVDAYFTGTLVVSREYFIYPTGGPNNSGNPPTSASHQASMNQNDSAYSSLYKLINNSFSKSSANSGANTPSSVSYSIDSEPSNSTLSKSSSSSSSSAASKRTKLIKYYAILRHGNLFLYEDSDHEILKHVVVIAHHLVALWPPNVPDGELFAKRSAICLVKIPYSHGASNQSDAEVAEMLSDRSKPPKNAFYLYSDNASEKEDFYFALIRASKRNSLRQAVADHKPASQFNPVYMAHPLHYKTADIMDLIHRLHASDANIQTRWLNALLGRLFLGLKDTPPFTDFLRNKIATKLTRIKRPSYLGEIHVTKLACGNALPHFTNPKLVELTPEGKLTVDSDVTYDGKFSVQITTKVKLNLGQRFKAREVTVALAITLEHLEGKMIFRLKPPPSDRIWYTFESMPKMTLKIEPIVSSRQIKYSMVTKAIESKIRESIKESLVYPNFEDISFFNTRNEIYRGGIWDPTVRPDIPEQNESEPEDLDEGEADIDEALAVESAEISSESQPTTLRHRKTTPNLRTKASTESLSGPTPVATPHRSLSRASTRSMENLTPPIGDDTTVPVPPLPTGFEGITTATPPRPRHGSADEAHTLGSANTFSSISSDASLKSQKPPGTLMDTVKKWSGWYSKDRQNSTASMESTETDLPDAEAESGSHGHNSQESIRSKVKHVATDYKHSFKSGRAANRLSIFKESFKHKDEVEHAVEDHEDKQSPEALAAAAAAAAQFGNTSMMPSFSDRRKSTSSVKSLGEKPRDAPAPHTFPPELMELLKKEKAKEDKKKDQPELGLSTLSDNIPTESLLSNQLRSEHKDDVLTSESDLSRTSSVRKKQQHVARKPVHATSNVKDETDASSHVDHESVNPSVELLGRTSSTTAVTSSILSIDSAGIPITRKIKRSGSSNSTGSSNSGSHPALSSSNGSESHINYGAASSITDQRISRKPSLLHTLATSPPLRSQFPHSPKSLRNQDGNLIDDDFQLPSVSPPQRHPATIEVNVPSKIKPDDVTSPTSPTSPNLSKKPFIKPDETPESESNLAPASSVSSAGSFLTRGFSVRRKAIGTGNITPKAPSILSAEVTKRREAPIAPIAPASPGEPLTPASTSTSVLISPEAGVQKSPYTVGPSPTANSFLDQADEKQYHLLPELATSSLTTPQPVSPRLLLPAESKEPKEKKVRKTRGRSTSQSHGNVTVTKPYSTIETPTVSSGNYPETPASSFFGTLKTSISTSFKRNNLSPHASESADTVQNLPSETADHKGNRPDMKTPLLGNAPKPQPTFSAPKPQTNPSDSSISAQPQEISIPHIAAPPQLPTRTLTKRISNDYLRGRSGGNTNPRNLRSSQSSASSGSANPGYDKNAGSLAAAAGVTSSSGNSSNSGGLGIVYNSSRHALSSDSNSSYSSYNSSDVYGGNESTSQSGYQREGNEAAIFDGLDQRGSDGISVSTGVPNSASVGSMSSITSSTSMGSLGSPFNIAKPVPATTKFMHDLTLDEFSQRRSVDTDYPYTSGLGAAGYGSSSNLSGDGNGNGDNGDVILPMSLPPQQRSLNHKLSTQSIGSQRQQQQQQQQQQQKAGQSLTRKISAQNIKQSLGQSFSSLSSIRRVANVNLDEDEDDSDGDVFDDEDFEVDFDGNGNGRILSESGNKSIRSGSISGSKKNANQQLPNEYSMPSTMNYGMSANAGYAQYGGGGGPAITTPPAPVMMTSLRDDGKLQKDKPGQEFSFL